MRCPRRPSTRAAISRAALFVNVIARIEKGLTPCSLIRYAIRCVRARVLPDPAPATISTGPSVCNTASACTGFRASTRGERTATALIVGAARRVSAERSEALWPGSVYSRNPTEPATLRGMAETEILEGAVPARPQVRRRKSRRGRILRIAGLVFIAAALVLAGYLWWNLWGTGLATQRAQDDLRPGFDRNLASLTPADAPDRVVKVPGDAVAIIRIPKIDVDYVVVEGTDTESLKKGPGHYTDTAYPWQDTGRVGIAGHRTTYLAPFWSLNELRPGDRIVLATEYGIFDYRVTRTVVTPPSGILPSGDSVLRQTVDPSLVLTTCNPRFSASTRLVVIADRVD